MIQCVQKSIRAACCSFAEDGGVMANAGLGDGIFD
jgi:hypothetical protein